MIDLALQTGITPISAVHLNIRLARQPGRKLREKIMAWLSQSPASQFLPVRALGKIGKSDKEAIEMESI